MFGEGFWISAAIGMVFTVASVIGQHRYARHWQRWEREDRLNKLKRDAKAARWVVRRNAFLKRAWFSLTGRRAQLVDTIGEHGRDDVVESIARIPVSRTQVLP